MLRSEHRLLHRTCPLLAQSGHSLLHCTCPLSRSVSGVKRTCRCAAHMSAFDPKRTMSVNSVDPINFSLKRSAIDWRYAEVLTNCLVLRTSQQQIESIRGGNHVRD